MLQITALMDNRLTEREDLKTEHGLSFHICCHGKNILFDCGSSDGVQFNARKLGIDLRELDAVVLSHGHYDHAGGFRFLVRSGTDIPRLYIGPGFFDEKYERSENCFANLSAGFDARFLEENGIAHQQVDGLLKLCPGCYAVSGFPRLQPMETIPERFVVRREGALVPDDFRDEVCLVLETGEGLVLLVGCAHPGIVNMADHVYRLFGKPIRAIFGGTHLAKAKEDRIRMTVSRLQAMGVSLFGLSHCSGEGIECALRAREGLRVCHLGPGDCVFFD